MRRSLAEPQFLPLPLSPSPTQVGNTTAALLPDSFMYIRRIKYTPLSTTNQTLAAIQVFNATIFPNSFTNYTYTEAETAAAAAASATANAARVAAGRRLLSSVEESSDEPVRLAAAATSRRAEFWPSRKGLARRGVWQRS